MLRGGLKPDDNSATRAIGYRQGMECLIKWQANPASLDPKAMVRNFTLVWIYCMQLRNCLAGNLSHWGR